MTQAACPGCGVTIRIYMEGGREVSRDLAGAGSKKHLCSDPARRECVEMSQEQYSYRCESCGTRDVAISTWGRVVEFPDLIWMLPEWPDPLQPHVCNSSVTGVTPPTVNRVRGVPVMDL